MINQHPITPPPELLKQWEEQWAYEHEPTNVVLRRVFQAGADQELDACCEWLEQQRQRSVHTPDLPVTLRAVRRPKAPSLKEQALAALLHLDHGQHNERCLIIRQALEQIDD